MICENCGKEIESYIGINEFAKRVGLSRSTIERDVKSGRIKGFMYSRDKFGYASRILIPESEIEVFKEKYFIPATE